jgi:hypothetical protein
MYTNSCGILMFIPSPLFLSLPPSLSFSFSPSLSLPSLQAWLQQCYQSACDTYQLDSQFEESDWEGYRSGYSKEDYRIQVYEKPQPERSVCNSLRTVHSKGVYSAIIKSRTKLQAPISE